MVTEGLLKELSFEWHFEEGDVHGIDRNRRLFLGRRQVTLENTDKTKWFGLRAGVSMAGGAACEESGEVSD